MHDRAAQFSPFAALTGYEEEIRESGRLTEIHAELSEDEKNKLDVLWTELIHKYDKGMIKEVTVKYFEPDKKKKGGSFKILTGKISKIDLINRVIVMEGILVDINKIVALQW